MLESWVGKWEAGVKGGEMSEVNKHLNGGKGKCQNGTQEVE